MKPSDPFPRLLHVFFHEWMVQQRNASVHTVRSYRDTWRLLALERIESPARSGKRPSWKQDQSVLAWLDTL